MTPILIAGGAGYIGSHCARILREAGYHCIIYDNLSEGHREAVRGFTLVEGELSDTALLCDVMERHGICAVLHFAAFALVGESMKDPLAYYQNNIGGTASLLTAMRDAGVGRLVFSSTCATYGEDVPVPITEDVPQRPCNPYGESKLYVESLLRRSDAAYGIKSVSLRYFNAAGAMPDGSIGEAHRLETHLIPLVLKAALREKAASGAAMTGLVRGGGGIESGLRVYGTDYPTPDGSAIRDYIHVLDLAQAHLLALRYLEDGGETDVFNLGTGRGHSVLEVIDCARKVTGRAIMYEEAARRPGDPPVLVAAADKAQAVLGWVPERSDLESIIKDAWGWHESHPGGYAYK